jgi:hypothetical protein
MTRWLVVRLGGAALCGTALIGLLHMPAARPLLAWLGACPVRATPMATVRARERALIGLRGTGTAPARPALGFTLDTMTLADVRAWAAGHRLACAASMQDTLLKCDGVPAAAIPGATGPVDEVAFGFRASDGRLASVTTITVGLAASAASARVTATAASLSAAIGAGPTASRLPSDASDAIGPRLVAYRFSDYIAGVSAMPMTGRGVVVREYYTSARASIEEE